MPGDEQKNAPHGRATYPPIITVQQHILQEQQRFPGVSGEFSWLLSGITLATKMIRGQGPPGRADRYSGRRRRRQRAGRSAAEARCLRQRGAAALPGRARAASAMLASEENERSDRRAAMLAQGQVRRDLRSARRLVEYRRERERRHDLFDPCVVPTSADRSGDPVQ